LGEQLLCKQSVVGHTTRRSFGAHQPEIAMKRKPSAPRNPFVAAALFKKAGSHAKPHKAVRRAQKVALGVVAQGQSMGLLIPRRPFDPARPHHRGSA
jgi:hypothetical protein